MKISEFTKILISYTADTIFIEHGADPRNDETLTVDDFVSKYKNNDDLLVEYIFIEKVLHNELCIHCNK